MIDRGQVRQEVPKLVWFILDRVPRRIFGWEDFSRLLRQQYVQSLLARDRSRSHRECLVQLSVTTPEPWGRRVTKDIPGSSWGERQESLSNIDPNKDHKPMTIITRFGLGFSAALLSLSIALAPAAFAQDKMGKDDGMQKDSTSN